MSVGTQHPHLCILIVRAGALKATGNRGLQPAMDFLFENEGKEIPDLSSVSESTSRPARDAMDVDDDGEDAAALQSLGVKVANDVEAKSIKCSECGKGQFERFAEQCY